MRKEFVTVDCATMADDLAIPSCVYWNDGKRYRIQRLLHIAASPNTEFEGIRYTVLIGEAQKNIYNNNGTWYVLVPG